MALKPDEAVKLRTKSNEVCDMVLFVMHKAAKHYGPEAVLAGSTAALAVMLAELSFTRSKRTPRDGQGKPQILQAEMDARELEINRKFNTTGMDFLRQYGVEVDSVDLSKTPVTGAN